MREISRKITVDLARRGSARSVFAVRNDKGARNLSISLTDDGAPYQITEGTVAVLNYRRPDDLCGALAATVENNAVQVELHPIVIAEVGITACSVSLYDEQGNKLTSSEFALDVSEDLYEGAAIDANPEYTLLDGLMKQVSEITIEENERALAESERAEAEERRQAAEAERDKRAKENLGVSGAVTLVATKWSSVKTQSINISGLRETDLVIFYPSSDSDRAVLANYGVFILPDAVGETVIASAKALPVSDISVRYFIVRGRIQEEV